MFEFSKTLKIKSDLQALWVPKIEICGVINAKGKPHQTLNMAEDPEQNFVFELKELSGSQASWHTHPDTTANLSIADYWFFMQWSAMLHFIVSTDEVRCYGVTQGTVKVLDETQDYSAWLSERSLS